MLVNKKNNAGIIILVLILAGSFFWSLYAVFLLGDMSTYGEDGLLENIQSVVLFITSIVFLIPGLYRKRDGKLVFLFFSLLSFSFALREVDVETFDIPSILIVMGSGIGKKYCWL